MPSDIDQALTAFLKVIHVALMRALGTQVIILSPFSMFSSLPSAIICPSM